MAKENKEKMKNFKKSFSTKSVKVGGYSAAACAIVIVIAIVINLIVAAVPERITKLDTTSNKIYSLSQQTKELVSGLEKDVEIYYYTTSDGEISYVTNLLSKVCALNSRVTGKTVDSDVEPDFCEQYTDESAAPGSIIVVCGDKTKVITSDELISYEAGSYENYVYYLQQYGYNTNVYFNGEVSLVNAIDYVTSDKTYKVCFISSSEADMSLLSDAVEQENIECVTLEGADESIPSDVNCVVLSVKDNDMSDAIYNKVSDYVSSGGKLYVEIDSSLEDYANTERLLALYSVKLSDSVIHETVAGRYFSKSDTYICPIFSEEHAIVYPFSGLDMYSCVADSKSIEFTKKDGLTFTPLLKTSAKAYTSDEDSKSELYPAAAVENANTGSDIVIMATDMLMDSSLSEEFTCNVDLFKNCVSWLCDKENSISVHAKALSTESKLTFGSDTFNSVFRVVMLIAVPAAIIAVGIVVWYRRRTR